VQIPAAHAAPAAAASLARITVPDLSRFVGDIVDPDFVAETGSAADDFYDPSSEVLHAVREAPPSDANEPIPFDSLFDDDHNTPILIKPESSSLGSHIGGEKPAERSFDDSISPEDVPEHLGALNHYMVCDHKDVVARFEHDDRGWMVKLKDGFVRAKLVANKIPQFGKFVLVEVGVKQADDGLHLKYVKPFRLADQYALNKLAKGDDAILAAITGRAELNTAQKSHVRDLVRKHFLPHVAAEVDQFMR
jgi:hypothetical protein